MFRLSQEFVDTILNGAVIITGSGQAVLPVSAITPEAFDDLTGKFVHSLFRCGLCQLEVLCVHRTADGMLPILALVDYDAAAVDLQNIPVLLPDPCRDRLAAIILCAGDLHEVSLLERDIGSYGRDGIGRDGRFLTCRGEAIELRAFDDCRIVLVRDVRINSAVDAVYRAVGRALPHAEGTGISRCRSPLSKPMVKSLKPCVVEIVFQPVEVAVERAIVGSMQLRAGDDDYIRYLEVISTHDTHAGYFSVDKKGKMTDSKLSDKKAGTSDDIDAYDLIMKNKELLLDRDPKKSPVRFIFSHSALREGWDNPNVFQICTLKQSSSEVRKRQEVGRGLRLCVNQDGERMDANVLGNDVQSINVLTVIASESYDSFAKGLQTELADAVADRPVAVTADLFKDKVIVDAGGNEQVVDGDTAQAIYFDLIVNGYIDKKGVLTDKYYADKANGAIQVAEEVADSRDSVINILDSVYDSRAMQPENARDKNVELQVDPDKLAMPEFKALWKRISPKSVYVVDFDTDELVKKAIASLNQNLHVPKIFFKVETGAMDEIKSKDSLLDGSAFSKSKSSTYDSSKQIRVGSSVKYDLIGKLVGETGLTRKTVVAILTGIEKSVFEQFKFNPEEFIIKAAALINDEKATAIIQHITYNVLDEHYDTDIFTEPTIKGKLGTNAMKAQRHLYDHIVYDSTNERDFAADLDTNTDVAVYVKLPDSFYIATPVGHYNPDWAIAFYEGTVKHIYFVAETKGSMSSMQLRLIEESKIHCAREHFKAISNGNVVYDVVDSYQALLEKVMK